MSVCTVCSLDMPGGLLQPRPAEISLKLLPGDLDLVSPLSNHGWFMVVLIPGGAILHTAPRTAAAVCRSRTSMHRMSSPERQAGVLGAAEAIASYWGQPMHRHT